MSQNVPFNEQSLDLKKSMNVRPGPWRPFNFASGHRWHSHTYIDKHSEISELSRKVILSIHHAYTFFRHLRMGNYTPNLSKAIFILSRLIDVRMRQPISRVANCGPDSMPRVYSIGATSRILESFALLAGKRRRKADSDRSPTWVPLASTAQISVSDVLTEQVRHVVSSICI